MKKTLAILIIFIFSACNSKEKISPIIYEVNNGRGTVYILGSIHSGDGSVYPLPDYISNRFQSSSTLVMEIKPGYDTTAVLKQKFLEAADNISNHLSAKAYNLVKKYSHDSGIPMSILETHKPMALISFIEKTELEKNDFLINYGLEGHFHYEANKNDIMIDGFDTFDELLEITNKTDSVDAEKKLLETIERKNEASKFIETIWKNWESGNTTYFESFVEEQKSKYPSFINMVFKRNKKMATQIKTFLNNSENTFVLVGYGHLVGKESVINLLENDGYNVTVIQQ